MRTALIPLRKHLREALRRRKDTLSYNLAALKYIKRQSEAELTAEFFEAEAEMDEEKVRERIAERRCGGASASGRYSEQSGAAWREREAGRAQGGQRAKARRGGAGDVRG